MKKILAICILIVCLLLACGGGGADDEHSAIEDTIRGYVETYNAQDYAQCLTYFTDYGDEGDALGALAFFRGLSGELGLQEVRNIAITDQTATVTVVFTIGGEKGTDQMQLRKVNGKWKIIWEQEGEALVVANDQSVVTNEDTAVAVTLSGSDAYGNPLTYTIVDTPVYGSLSGTAPNVTYTPNAGYIGYDSFTFKVNDGSMDSNIATVSITVGNVAAMTEYNDVQAGVNMLMSGNNLTSIPNPISSTTATNNMSAFPDVTSNAANGGKVSDEWGNPYIFPGDKPGYILYGHDYHADGNHELIMMYQIDSGISAYYYTVEADGTVRQYSDAAKTNQLNGPP